MQNILHKLLDPVRFLNAFFWDTWMNVETTDTDSFNKLTQGVKGDAHPFQNLSHYTVRKAIELVQPTPDDTVIVLGSAKGRPVCHFARHRVKKVIGIEIDPELASISEKNANTLRGRKAPIEIKAIDAAMADYSEGSIFYLPNSFGADTLRSVLKNIEQSHVENKKPLQIIYVVPRYIEVFDEFPWLEKIIDVTRLTGFRTVIFKASY